MTYDGFILVTMSYNGEFAMTIKEAYIAKHNQMREKLQLIAASAQAAALSGEDVRAIVRGAVHEELLVYRATVGGIVKRVVL